MESFTCPHCREIIPSIDWLKYPPDPEWLFTLEDDEPDEWLCPKCLTGFVLAPKPPKQMELFQ